MTHDDGLEELLVRALGKTPLLDAIQRALEDHWWTTLATPGYVTMHPEDYNALCAEVRGKPSAIVSLTSLKTVEIVLDPSFPAGSVCFSDTHDASSRRHPLAEG